MADLLEKDDDTTGTYSKLEVENAALQAELEASQEREALVMERLKTLEPTFRSLIDRFCENW